MKILKAVSIGSVLAIALVACVEVSTGGTTQPNKPRYSPPEESGLIGWRPYPSTGSICQMIGENELTIDYLDDSATLVGCPIYQQSAIADLQAVGGSKITTIGQWQLLRVPN